MRACLLQENVEELSELKTFKPRKKQISVFQWYRCESRIAILTSIEITLIVPLICLVLPKTLNMFANDCDVLVSFLLLSET